MSKQLLEEIQKVSDERKAHRAVTERLDLLEQIREDVRMIAFAVKRVTETAAVLGIHVDINELMNAEIPSEEDYYESSY